MEGMAGRTLVVDALNLAFRWKHAGRTDFRNDYVATVVSLAASYKCSNVIITADWGSSTYRKDILPEYKQNRKEKYDQQTEEEAQAFKDFFEEYEETLELPKFSSESDQKLVTIIPSQQEPDKKKRKLKKPSIDNVKIDEPSKEGMA